MNKEKVLSGKYPVMLRIAALIIVIAGIMQASSIVVPLLMAVFISIICYTPVTWLQKIKIPKVLAITVVLLGIIALFVGLGSIIGSSLSSFSKNLPAYEENLNKMSQGIIQLLNEKGIKISADKFPGLFEPSKIMSFTADILGQLSAFMGNTLTILLLALFLLMEVDAISDKASIILKGDMSRVDYLRSISVNIRHYLSTKTIMSLLTALLIWLGLMIIGVDYAIIWALLAFLLNYIPNIGSIIAAIPPVLFAIVQLGYGGMLWTAGVYAAVNMVIGNVIEPRVMGRGMGLSTFVVLLSLIFWGFVLGTVGMFLSVPLTMALKIMLEQNPETNWIAILLGASHSGKQNTKADI